MDEGCVRVRRYVVHSGIEDLTPNKVRTEPTIDPESSGKTFARVFGTNTSAFELLALKRKIMGPCWLQIKKPHTENKGVRASSLRMINLTISPSRFRGANSR